MGWPPHSRSSRRLAAAALLTGACAAAVLAWRGSQPAWVPECPPYRQLGGLDAPVVIVEFSDFQCPACAAAVDALKRIKALFGPRVRILFKHLPWEKLHPWAKSAALAAECAGRQGKFWEFHDLLYLKQGEWSAGEQAGPILARYAESVQLDPAAYLQCLQDPATAAAVESDILQAHERWVHSTPTFFINGKRFVGASQLRREGLAEIERLLR